jgi:hypothetical protein
MPTIKSPGFGPGYWKNRGAPAATLPMALKWDNPSSFEIDEVNTFAVNLTVDATGSGRRSRGWDYSVQIINNTDPTNITLSGNVTGSVNTAGSPQTFTVNFPTSSFLTHGSLITQPSDTELQGKFGPVSGGDSDPKRYTCLNRNLALLPSAYRNQLVESITLATSATYPNNFDTVTPEYNKFAILLKVTRTNNEGASFTDHDYRVLIITFAPLIDIG